MAFKQNRESGSKLDSYEGMQSKGLINNIKQNLQSKKDQRTYIKEATSGMSKENAKATKKIIKKYGSVEAAKAIRDKKFTDDRPNIRMEKRNITVASKDDVKATGVGYGAQPIKEEMWVKKEILPHGGGERDLSYSPYVDPDKKKEKRTFSDWRQMRQAIHKEKVKIRNNPKYKNLKDGGFRDEKNQYGFITPGSKNRIKIEHKFRAPYVSGEEGRGEDESAPSGKSRAFALGSVGVVLGSWLTSQLGSKAKSVISGKPAQNTKTPYSNVNPNQQDLLSGRGKIQK